MKHLKVRIPMYFIGLFVMTIGIALCCGQAFL